MKKHVIIDADIIDFLLNFDEAQREYFTLEEGVNYVGIPMPENVRPRQYCGEPLQGHRYTSPSTQELLFAVNESTLYVAIAEENTTGEGCFYHVDIHGESNVISLYLKLVEDEESSSSGAVRVEVQTVLN